MVQEYKKFETRKIAPWILLGIVGVGLSFLAIDPKKVKGFLRREYRGTFQDLVDHSNEKGDVQLVIDNLPENSEKALAKWMNDALEANRRSIARGRTKPHHVMYEVLMSALSLAER
ncbi:MAG: hypothetical protein Q7U68_02370 [Candidatus Roizmanbacteria bacterium]|nr:hypothetical protein [Candidatus Roizmanbacteria bacterium]